MLAAPTTTVADSQSPPWARRAPCHRASATVTGVRVRPPLLAQRAGEVVRPAADRGVDTGPGEPVRAAHAGRVSPSGPLARDICWCISATSRRASVAPSAVSV
jgi:hypothetical protein